MSNHIDTFHRSVDERIKLIADALAASVDLDAKLPGLKPLLDDYLAPDVDVPHRDFHRRLLRTFRDSDADSAYQDLLGQYDADEQSRVSRFVDGEGADACCEGDFEMGPSLGTREHMQCMVESAAVHISAGGPVRVSGLSLGALEERDTLFYRFIQMLRSLFRTGDSVKDTVLVNPESM